MIRPEKLVGSRVTHRTRKYWGYVEAVTRIRTALENPRDPFGLRVRVGPQDARIASPSRLRFDSRVLLAECPACGAGMGADPARCPECGLPVCPAGECAACGCRYLAPRP